MLPVETRLHLQLKVAGERVGFNDVAVWARQAAGALGQELIRAAVWQMQVRHLESVRRGESEVTCPRCGVVHSVHGVLRRGTRPRKVRTSSGVVCFALIQLTCRDCTATWSPYPALLGLEPRARVSEELVRHLFEGVVQLSYAKTVKLADGWLGSSISARSLHRGVQERASKLEFTEAPAWRRSSPTDRSSRRERRSGVKSTVYRSSSRTAVPRVAAQAFRSGSSGSGLDVPAGTRRLTTPRSPRS
jgi:hypothetical protein